jgi:hypothetical protein
MLEGIWILCVPPLGLLFGLLFGRDVFDGIVGFALGVFVMQFGLLLAERRAKRASVA